MGLSDYDMAAFDENADPSNGWIHGCIEGTSVVLHKNWLYVRDESMWKAGGPFVHPTVAQVYSGVVRISDFYIDATCGPQSAIFAVVQTSSTEKHKRMACVGCKGYHTPFDVVAKEEGLDLAVWSLSCFSSVSRVDNDGVREDIKLCFTFDNEAEERRITVERPCEDRYDTQWVGILPGTYDAFLAWLDGTKSTYDGEYNAWVDKIKEATPFRSNQGDSYIASATGVDLQTSRIGEAEVPMIVKMFQERKDEE
jgi:hypothetical protein